MDIDLEWEIKKSVKGKWNYGPDGFDAETQRKLVRLVTSVVADLIMKKELTR